MSEKLSQSDYWTEIESLAKQVTAKSRENGTDINDLLHEAIDGHAYVIYTYKARMVCFHSDNEDAIFEDGCFPEAPESMTSLYPLVAYYAMVADVRAHEAFEADSDNDEESESDNG